jgi:hypothetical protein
VPTGQPTNLLIPGIQTVEVKIPAAKMTYQLTLSLRIVSSSDVKEKLVVYQSRNVP